MPYLTLHMIMLNNKLIVLNSLNMMDSAYLLWCFYLCTIDIVVIPYDPIPLSRKPCEIVDKDI